MVLSESDPKSDLVSNPQGGATTLVQVAASDGGAAENYNTESHDSAFADPNAEFTRPSTFRAGILQLLTSKGSITDTAGVHIVSRIKGDVDLLAAHTVARDSKRAGGREVCVLFLYKHPIF